MSSLVEHAWSSFPLGKPGTKRIRMPHILHAVTLHTGITADEIMSPRKIWPVLRARLIFCHLARTMTANSFPTIANYLNRDHTTVINACRSVERRIAKGNHALAEDIAAVQRTLTQMLEDGDLKW